MLEAGFGEVSQQGEGALSHLRRRILHTLVQQLHHVRADYQVLYVVVESLRQSGEQVQRHYHEVLVRRIKLLRVLHVGL